MKFHNFNCKYKNIIYNNKIYESYFCKKKPKGGFLNFRTFLEKEDFDKSFESSRDCF